MQTNINPIAAIMLTAIIGQPDSIPLNVVVLLLLFILLWQEGYFSSEAFELHKTLFCSEVKLTLLPLLKKGLNSIKNNALPVLIEFVQNMVVAVVLLILICVYLGAKAWLYVFAFLQTATILCIYGYLWSKYLWSNRRQVFPWIKERGFEFGYSMVIQFISSYDAYQDRKTKRNRSEKQKTESIRLNKTTHRISLKNKWSAFWQEVAAQLLSAVFSLLLLTTALVCEFQDWRKTRKQKGASKLQKKKLISSGANTLTTPYAAIGHTSNLTVKEVITGPLGAILVEAGAGNKYTGRFEVTPKLKLVKNHYEVVIKHTNDGTITEVIAIHPVIFAKEVIQEADGLTIVSEWPSEWPEDKAKHEEKYTVKFGAASDLNRLKKNTVITIALMGEENEILKISSVKNRLVVKSPMQLKLSEYGMGFEDEDGNSYWGDYENCGELRKLTEDEILLVTCSDTVLADCTHFKKKPIQLAKVWERKKPRLT